MNINFSFDASIIIPTYNRSKLLAYTLQSIVDQDLKDFQIEVLVIDDGSSDNTADIVKQFDGLLKIKYFFQEDLGFRVSEARNTGIKNAKGEICIFIDSGVVLSSKCIFEHIHMHLTTKDYISIIGYVYGFDNHNEHEIALEKLISEKGIDDTINYLSDNKQCLDLREDLYFKYNYKLENLPAAWVFFWTCNVSVKYNQLVSLRMFDTKYDLNWGMEDLDLGYRLQKDNIKIVLNKEASSIHYPHSKDKEDNFAQQAINKKYFHEKFNTEETKLFMDVTWLLNDYL